MITPGTEQAHQRYFLKGKRVPGSSTIAKHCQECEALMQFAVEQVNEGLDYTKVAAKQARIGEIAHALFQSFVTGENIDLSNCAAKEIVLARQSADKAISFWNRMGLGFVACELNLVSQDGYGGTLDVIGSRIIGDQKEEEFVLLDWKRTGGLYKSHLVQVWSYENLWNEVHPTEKISERYVIRLGKEGVADFEERKVEDWEMALLSDMFKGRLMTYKADKAWDKAHEKVS